MQFNVIRLTGITLESGAAQVDDWSFDRNGVRLEIVGQGHLQKPGLERPFLLVAGKTVVDGPLEIVEGAFIQIPESERKRVEHELQTFADALSVTFMCKRSLSAISPDVALEPLDDQAKDWLSRWRGIWLPMPGIPVRMGHQMALPTVMSTLFDRPDGAALLAEAQCQPHAAGRLHEFMRLFERAFALPAGKLCRDQLPRFLAAAPGTFMQSETVEWLELRHSASHADRAVDFVREADVTSVINRVELAAYDVLFNKLSWHHPTIERRRVFHPIVHSGAPHTADIVVIQGTTPRIAITTFDGFGVFPMNRSVKWNSPPSTWYTETRAHHL